MPQQASRRNVLKRSGALAALASVPVMGATAEETGTGTLAITVNEPKVVDDELVTVPREDIEISDGNVGLGPGLGRTDENGQLEAEVDAGERTLSIFNRYTRYYGVKDQLEVNVDAGERTEITYDFIPNRFRISADTQVEFGKALYVTGQTEFLGNWQRARKMGYNSSREWWALMDQLPVGAEFKIVRADWSEDDWIPTDNVDWERGSNRVIQEESPFGRFIPITTSPTF